jgi:hypothetical protein
MGGSASVPDVDHDTIAKSRLAQICIRRHDEFRFAQATGDSNHVARHRRRRCNCQLAGENDGDALALLRQLIVNAWWQIEYHSAVASVAADAYRHRWSAFRKACCKRQAGQQDG